MKRSEINELIRDTQSFLADHLFALPPFGYWNLEDWSTKGPKAHEIVDRHLGWDVTDFGQGRFEQTGLVIFTLRNGSPAHLVEGRGKLYAEKALVVGVDQVTPLHFHWSKTEDIINRGGGDLVVKLYASDPEEQLGGDNVTVRTDGVERTVEAGGILRLARGESITLTPGLYHTFWASGSTVLAGEVSTVNDDYTDNRFYEPLGRFPDIEEDEPLEYLLVNDYSVHAPRVTAGIS